MQRASRRLLRAADRRRDLAVGEIADVAQHHRRALALGQLADRSHSASSRSPTTGVSSPTGSAISATGTARRARARCASSALRWAIVSTHARRLCSRPSAQTRVRAQRRDERLLEAVLRVLAPTVATQEAPHAVAVRVEEALKGGRVALTATPGGVEGDLGTRSAGVSQAVEERDRAALTRMERRAGVKREVARQLSVS